MFPTAATSVRPISGTLAVSPESSVANLPPIGINVEGWSYYGADQFSSNVIMNPGFEPIIDRSIVIVKHANARGFSDDAGWLARRDGFWDGGSFQVRTGAAAGESGRIAHSIHSGADGMAWFTTSAQAPALSAGDVISVMRRQKSGAPAHWWIPPSCADMVAIDPGDHPPGGPGDSSARLALGGKQPTEIDSYLDGDHKFLPVNGRWRLSFWTKATAEGPSMIVTFGRIIPGSVKIFASRTMNLSPGWRRDSIDFTPDDNGPAGPLQLRFAASGPPHTAAWLGNVELGPADDLEAGAWRAQVIGALKKLRPGYLRDWQGQLGDTLTNRLAPIFARSPVRYNPAPPDNTGANFMYSLPDFLSLCHLVGARPWIVAPTTFYDSEFSGLGAYLAKAQQIYRFPEIAVEFGNENWNGVFRAAGIQNSAVMARAANRAFILLRKSAGPATPLHLVVNGFFAYAPVGEQAIINAPAADAVDVGPYFFYTLNSGEPEAAALSQMMDSTDMDGQFALLHAAAVRSGKETDAYEVNLSTVEGTAPSSQRNPLVAGTVSGAALANRLIAGMYAGLQRQNVYDLAQYNYGGSAGEVRLWGILHDLATDRDFRPTGLAVEMLNRAMPGNFHKVIEGGGLKGVNAAAFRSSAGWSLAIVSTIAAPTEVSVKLPAGGVRPSRVLSLFAPGLTSTNESRSEVGIVEARLAADLRLTIPAYGFVVLLPPTNPPRNSGQTAYFTARASGLNRIGEVK